MSAVVRDLESAGSSTAFGLRQRRGKRGIELGFCGYGCRGSICRCCRTWVRLAPKTKTELLGDRRATLGVVRCGERVINLQIPPSTAVARRQIMCNAEVATEHLAAPAALETDYKVSAVGSVDRNCRSAGRSWRILGSPERGEGLMNDGHKVWEFARGNAVVSDIPANDLGRAGGQLSSRQPLSSPPSSGRAIAFTISKKPAANGRNPVSRSSSKAKNIAQDGPLQQGQSRVDPG
jgi:hypothetical protein